MVFLKLKTWKKACIFEEASIFEGVLEVEDLEESFNSAVSDPTSTGGRSGFCRQIHRPGWSDRAPSSFREVILPSAIQLLSRDDRTFAVRSTTLVGEIGSTVLEGAMEHRCRWRGDTPVINPTSIEERLGFYRQIHRPVRSDREPLSFGEVTLPFPIQLLSKDDWAFAVRSTALIHRPVRSDRTPLLFREVTLPSAIQLLLGDDRAFALKSTTLIHRPGRSDRTPSSFVKMEVKLYHRHLLGEAKVELHRRHPLKATTY
ncbi:hypothetical protein E6C27_scaffold382G001150 [Cucumis melo var. makuwa]|uniref:Uncharacterized protein n=1 Tax=Cucumis melo var. makuwa TaxID=1194695 RepID=A0A5A7V418_CUCMM|nr:hypothetical protein E6C27_scaffold382G001150 [Cucumis melo var. makuwa]